MGSSPLHNRNTRKCAQKSHACGKTPIAVCRVRVQQGNEVPQTTTIFPSDCELIVKNLATDQAIAENDAAILRNVQRPNTAPQQNADDLIDKFCKVADANDVSTHNNVLIEGVDMSISHSLRIYCATNKQEYLTNIAFPAESLFANSEGIGKTSNKPLSENQNDKSLQT